MKDYNEQYFNIRQVEQRLEKNGLAIKLAKDADYKFGFKTKLITMFKDAVAKNNYKNVFIFRDLSDANENGEKICRGIFVVAANVEQMSEVSLAKMFGDFVKSNKNLDRGPSSAPTNTQNCEQSSEEDLNAEAEELDKNNLIFGVIQGEQYEEVVSKIEGVEIIKSVGNLQKIYFSAPSFKRSQVIAHPVNILEVIKSKDMLLDYYINN